MNGKHQDHPISDILDHNLRVFGEPTDTNIKTLGKLMDRHRLFSWYEDLPYYKPEDISRAVSAKVAELEKHAKESGWETS